MSDGMTYDVAAPPPVVTSVPTSRRSVVRQVIEVVLVLVIFAAVGLAAGWLWEHWWQPTTGAVVDGKWYPGTRVEGDFLVSDFPGLRGYFNATASFLLIGVVAGLVLGILSGLVGRRSELIMLAVVVAGSALACYLAYRLGVHLGPPDPDPIAASAKNGTVLPSNLSLTGKSPFVGWTLGALLGLGVTYFLTSGVSESRRREHDDPRWLSRNQIG